MEPIIKVENLTKVYRIGLREQLHDTFMGSVVSMLRAPVTNFRRLKKLNTFSATGEDADLIFALRDLSLEMEQGETLGIIGSNGAGKSTLLKIISRITEPTAGRVTLRGRVASLLEVGTGFHQDLTGRENIYMNGIILGMKKREIDRKFDEIVDFSGVEKFLDTPIKRYSSGMQVRLAFAVAAHLEPEILVVDEVLAVGDQQFQKKCLGKMRDSMKSGRTVLFVSHNMAAVESLCSRVLVLNGGSCIFAGPAIEGIRQYLHVSREPGKNLAQFEGRPGRGRVRVTGVAVGDESGGRNVPFPIGSKLNFILDYAARENIRNVVLSLGIYDEMDAGITRFDTDIAGGFNAIPAGIGQIVCSTEAMNLAPGRYFVNVAFFSSGVFEDYAPYSTQFEMASSDYFGTGKLFDRNGAKVFIQHRWDLREGSGQDGPDGYESPERNLCARL